MRNKKHKFRFMAMSKLIGIIFLFIAFSVMIYSMVVMVISNNYDSLSTLIQFSLSSASIYGAFYINMAKAEHIEDIKGSLKKEIESMRLKGVSEEEISYVKDELNATQEVFNNVMQENSNGIGG